MLSLSEGFSGVHGRAVDVTGFGITESPDLYAPFRRFVFHILAKANSPFERDHGFIDGHLRADVVKGLMFCSKKVMKLPDLVEFIVSW